MLLIYSPEISQRLEYTLDLIFGQHLGIPYRITSFREEILLHQGPRLAYAFTPIEDILTIPASGLLFEPEISDQRKRLEKRSNWNELPVLFTIPGNFALPFDIFSAVFYVVVRYEEYLPFEPDTHHRFQSGESIAFHAGFLDRPIVNEWILALAEWIAKEIPGLQAPVFPSYRFISTIDIDQAWAYKHKGWRRTVAGYLKDWKSMELRNYRYQAIRGNQTDPYDTYELIHHYHQEVGIDPVWFFLLGDHGLYDKNCSYRNKAFRSLIQKISQVHEVGIHPSYASNSSSERTIREIQRLEEIISTQVTKSRQHFLRFEMPQTFRLLNHLGIQQDYTLGYAERTGFRAGIASPVYFFDLEENKTTDLQLIPFEVMDVTLKDYLGLNPEEAVEHVTDIIRKVKSVHGTFVTLWHNESLSEWKEWAGWSGVYLKILMAASS